MLGEALLLSAGGRTPRPFPFVAASATSEASGTSHVVNLPSGIASGDLLIVCFTTTNNTTFTWPSGWTLLATIVSNNYETEVRYRIADGTEGASITVTTGASGSTAHCAVRITDHGSGVNAPEAAIAHAANSSINPPGLTPTGGAKNYLWLEGYGINGTGTSTGQSTNYTMIANTSNGAPDTAIAYRELNAATEDPGLMSATSVVRWIAWTIAVYPET
jgi:hypothetical protein